MKFNKQADSGHKGPNKFLKIEDGKSINGIFRGEIHTFYNKWENGKGRECAPDEPGAKPRFKLNFVTYEDNAFKALIFEFPQTVYNQLADIHDVYPLDQTKVKVSRRGTGTDTVYMILPLVNEPISPATMKQIEAIDLHVLDTGSGPRVSGSISKAGPNWDQMPSESGPDELPF